MTREPSTQTNNSAQSYYLQNQNVAPKSRLTPLKSNRCAKTTGWGSAPQLCLLSLCASILFGMAGCAATTNGGSNSNPGGNTPPGTTIPATPSGLQASAGNAQVSLTWSASTGATTYHIKRATTTGGPYTQVSAPATAAFTDVGLTNGTTYFYVVSAVNSAGESANSPEVSAKPSAPVQAPPAPTGVVATAGNAQVSLTWAASVTATSYNVKRSTTTGGPYAT